MIGWLNFSARQRIKLGFAHTVYGLSGAMLNFVISLLLVRQFSAQLWGDFAQQLIWVTTFSLLTGWGNKDFLLREFSRQGRVTELWLNSLISRLPLLLIVLPAVFFFDLSGSPWLFVSWLAANFMYRSFDSIVVFERRFLPAIGIELTGFLIVVVALVTHKGNVDIHLLITLFLVATSVKMLLAMVLIGRQAVGNPDFRFLIAALPYFLPSFVGFLQAKADTFAIALQLPKKELGEYYLLISLMSYCHAVAVMIITPFLKNIYRINIESFQKIKHTFFVAGLGWSVVCITGIYFVLEYIYRIHLPVYDYAIAWIALPPYFIYFLLMQQLFREDNPYPITLINLVTAVLNFLMSLLLINRFGFTGGLLTCAFIQWATLLGFLFLNYFRSPEKSTFT